MKTPAALYKVENGRHSATLTRNGLMLEAASAYDGTSDSCVWHVYSVGHDGSRAHLKGPVYGCSSIDEALDAALAYGLEQTGG